MRLDLRSKEKEGFVKTGELMGNQKNELVWFLCVSQMFRASKKTLAGKPTICMYSRGGEQEGFVQNR